MELTPNSDFIRTFTGKLMNVFNPEPEMICIEDIAHALSLQCRFSGHISGFYSVAQHSVLVAKLVPEPLKLQALLHDASEAYLVDIPRPIKKGLNNYNLLEHKLMLAIAAKFRFKYPLDIPVVTMDDEMLQFEWNHLVLGQPIHGQTFHSWAPKEAETYFLEYFNLLNLGINKPAKITCNHCSSDNVSVIVNDYYCNNCGRTFWPDKIVQSPA